VEAINNPFLIASIVLVIFLAIMLIFGRNLPAKEVKPNR
jgi:hypothetical protein